MEKSIEGQAKKRNMGGGCFFKNCPLPLMVGAPEILVHKLYNLVETLCGLCFWIGWSTCLKRAIAVNNVQI